MRAHLVLVFASSLSTALAQHTWTVGGSSPDFPSIQAAVAAARDGDTVLVRAGTYDVGIGVTTNKALRILGDPHATWLVSNPLGQALRVQGLAAGKELVVADFTFTRQGSAAVFNPTPIVCSQDAGHVHLQRLDIHAGLGDLALTFQQCAQISMTDCSVDKLQLDCHDSGLALTRCTVHGVDNSMANLPSTALYAGRSDVAIADSVLIGGDGDAMVFPMAGLEVVDGQTVIAGRSRIASGKATGRQPTSAILLGGLLWLDPAVPLQPMSGAPAISAQAGQTPITAPAPIACTASGGALGTTVTVQVRSQEGQAILLFAGRPGNGPIHTDFGDFWLDPTQFTLAAVGVEGPSTPWTYTMPVPSRAAMRGVVVGFQAFVGAAGLPLLPTTRTAVAFY